MLLLIMSGVACSGHGYVGTIVCVTLSLVTSLIIVSIHGISKACQRIKKKHRRLTRQPRPKYNGLDDDESIFVRESLILDEY